MDLESWLRAKTAAMERLRRDREEGRVDSDIMGLLEAINGHPDYFTTSSCSGRVQLAEATILNLREGFRSIAKWHSPPRPGEVLDAVSRAGNAKNLWLSVQPPIVHVASRTLDSARTLLGVARSRGFKHSGIISLRLNVVEINASERADIPIVLNGKLLLNSEGLEEIEMLAAKLLSNVKRKIEILEKEFRSGALAPPENWCKH